MTKAIVAAVAIAALAAFGLSLPAGVANAQDGAAAGAAAGADAVPRQNVMKVCGDKWRAVRDAEAAKGVTWPQFLSSCRTAAAATRTAPASPSGSVSPSQQPAGQVAASRPDADPTSAAKRPVFPDLVSPRHASERPALARQRTCADQFKANKATQANGGLRWIERGGGYWSQCNAHLKQTRA